MSLLDEARTVRERILARLRELEPLVEEYNELKEVAAEMGIELPAEAGARRQGRRASATSASGRRNAPAGGRSRAGAAVAAEDDTSAGRSAGATGQIAERVLQAVRAEPGRTVGQYAEILGVSATALYRPVRELTNEGVLVKRARQLFPA